MPDTHYLAPGRLTRTLNPVVAGLVRLGVPMAGAAVLAVRGRRSGEIRAVPVNPMPLDGRRYLVSARGEGQWVRNARAAGEAELRRGRRVERIALRELGDGAKVPVLRAYLRAWAWEVGAFFDGVDAESPDATLAALAPRHPVFEVTAHPGPH